MQQELITREADVSTEQQERKERTRFEALIQDTDTLTVELTRRTETLTAEKVREAGRTRTVIDLDEDEETTTFTIPDPDQIYAHLIPEPWDILEAALTTTAVLPVEWIPAAPAPPADRARPEPLQPISMDRPFGRHLPIQPQHDREEVDTLDVGRREEYRPELVPIRPRRPHRRAGTTETAPLEKDSDTPLQAKPGRVHPWTDRLEDEARKQDGLLATIQEGNVLKAFYDPAENENGTSHRLLYTVQEEATVRETLLDLVDHGTVTATITRQPFYSPQPFEKDGRMVEGWTDAYAVVALDGMPIQMTEFSYGSDEPELAEDDIASVTVKPGEMIDFAAAEAYTCGTDRETTAVSRTAWEEHDTYRWFDDDWERSVYAALAAGHAFEGSPLDLSHAPRVRNAYIDAFGEAPEDAFDNVVYRG